MTLFYETNIWSKHRQYLQQCEKKTLTLINRCMHLKKALILVEEKKPATMQILLMLQPK